MAGDRILKGCCGRMFETKDCTVNALQILGQRIGRALEGDNRKLSA